MRPTRLNRRLLRRLDAYTLRVLNPPKALSHRRP